MNKRYLILALITGVILLTICLMYAQQITKPEGIYVEDVRNTNGTLTFTVRTVTYNGAYAPRNAGAIWITNSSNQFVKTLKVWAASYRYTLVRWLTNSANNTIGAVTGASLNSHQLHTVTWNATNSSGANVEDGNYTVNVEYTEHNATNSNPGKSKTVTFTKGVEVVDNTPANDNYFQNLHLVWTPVPPANGLISGIVKTTDNVPIVGALVTTGTYSATSSANGIFNLDLPPGTYTLTCQAGEYQTQTIDNVIVNSSLTTFSNFVLNPVVSISDNYNTSPVLLNQNHPNPFSMSTVIKYDLSKSSNVTLIIYNTKGQMVRTLINGYKSNGIHEVSWDGKDDNGKKLATGNYTCLLKTGSSKRYIKMNYIN